MEKRKLKITLEVLNEVTVHFLETEQFIEERLELRPKVSQRKYNSGRGNLSSFYKSISKALEQKNNFYCVGFKAEMF